MLKGAVARRYARAIFDIATSRGDLDSWLADLRTMAAVLSHPEMAVFMDNPKVPLETKKEIVDRAIPGIDQVRRNLLHLLIGKRRTDLIGQISAEFEELVNDYRGIAYADVTTAVPLSDAEAKVVADRLSAITGKRVQLRISVDPALIGGIVARVGDRLLDGSVRGRLLALRQRLAGTAV